MVRKRVRGTKKPRRSKGLFPNIKEKGYNMYDDDTSPMTGGMGNGNSLASAFGITGDNLGNEMELKKLQAELERLKFDNQNLQQKVKTLGTEVISKDNDLKLYTKQNKKLKKSNKSNQKRLHALEKTDEHQLIIKYQGTIQKQETELEEIKQQYAIAAQRLKEIDETNQQLIEESNMFVCPSWLEKYKKVPRYPIGLNKHINRGNYLELIQDDIQEWIANPSIDKQFCGITGIGKTHFVLSMARNLQIKRMFPSGIFYNPFVPISELPTKREKRIEQNEIQHEETTKKSGKQKKSKKKLKKKEQKEKETPLFSKGKDHSLKRGYCNLINSCRFLAKILKNQNERQRSLILWDTNDISMEQIGAIRSIDWGPQTMVIITCGSEDDLTYHSYKLYSLRKLTKAAGEHLLCCYLGSDMVLDTYASLFIKLVNRAESNPYQLSVMGASISLKLIEEESHLGIQNIIQEHINNYAKPHLGLKSYLLSLEMNPKSNMYFNMLVKCAIFPARVLVPIGIFAILLNTSIPIAKQIITHFTQLSILSVESNCINFQDDLLTILQEIVKESNEYDMVSLTRSFLVTIKNCCISSEGLEKNRLENVNWSQFKHPFEGYSNRDPIANDTYRYLFRYLNHHLTKAGEIDISKWLLQQENWFAEMILHFPQDWPNFVQQELVIHEPALLRLGLSLLHDIEEGLIQSSPSLALSNAFTKFFTSQHNLDFIANNVIETTGNTIISYKLGKLNELDRFCGFDESEEINPEHEVGTWCDDTFIPQKYNISTMTSMKHGLYLLFGIQDGRLYQVSLKQKTTNLLATYPSKVCKICTYKEDRYITGHEDGSVRINNFDPSSTPDVYNAHRSIITDIIVSNDGRYLFTASEDSDATIRMYDMQMGLEMKYFKGSPTQITSLMIDSQDRFLYASSFDGAISMFLIGQQYKKNVDKADGRWFTHQSGGCTVVCLLRSGRYCIAGFEDTIVRLFDMPSKSVVDYYTRHNDIIRSVELSSSKQYVVSSDWSGLFVISEIKNQEGYDYSGTKDEIPYMHQIQVINMKNGIGPTWCISKNVLFFNIGESYRSNTNTIDLTSSSTQIVDQPSTTLYVALVIGNGNYKKITPCPHAMNDAERIERFLVDTLNFDEEFIYFDTEMKFDKMLAMIDNYQDAIVSLKYKYPKSKIVSVVYYSGQVESGQFIPSLKSTSQNYLLPVDFVLPNKSLNQPSALDYYMKQHAISLSRLLHFEADFQIVLFDGVKRIGQELHPIYLPDMREYLLCYSNVYRLESSNSIFTSTILDTWMDVPEGKLSDIFEKIQTDMAFDENNEEDPTRCTVRFNGSKLPDEVLFNTNVV